MLLEIPLGKVFKQERWFLEKLLINSTQYLSVSEPLKAYENYRGIDKYHKYYLL